MIIIPEISTIYVRVPGNEDGSFSQAILNTYKESRVLYDQMEVDGIPLEFKHYNKFGFVRNPIDRLWNFYNDHRRGAASPYSTSIYGVSTKDYDFETWLMLNSACFPAEISPVKNRHITPKDTSNNFSLYDFNSIIHHIPENQKSQYFYLMPTSGASNLSEEAKDAVNNVIVLFPYSHINDIAQTLSVRYPITAESKYGDAPEIKTKLLNDSMSKFFAWDYRLEKNLKAAVLREEKSKNA